MVEGIRAVWEFIAGAEPWPRAMMVTALASFGALALAAAGECVQERRRRAADKRRRRRLAK